MKKSESITAKVVCYLPQREDIEIETILLGNKKVRYIKEYANKTGIPPKDLIGETVEIVMGEKYEPTIIRVHRITEKILNTNNSENEFTELLELTKRHKKSNG